jgi:hypothetical protein
LTTLTSTVSHGSTSTYLWYENIPVATVITIPPGEICRLGDEHVVCSSCD